MRWNHRSELSGALLREDEQGWTLVISMTPDFFCVPGSFLQYAVEVQLDANGEPEYWRHI